MSELPTDLRLPDQLKRINSETGIGSIEEVRAWSESLAAYEGALQEVTDQLMTFTLIVSWVSAPNDRSDLS